MALKKFAFKVLKENEYARCGLIETHRGNIKTPTFMPVGTQATVKACTIDDLVNVSQKYLFNESKKSVIAGENYIEEMKGLNFKIKNI